MNGYRSQWAFCVPALQIISLEIREGIPRLQLISAEAKTGSRSLAETQEEEALQDLQCPLHGGKVYVTGRLGGLALCRHEVHGTTSHSELLRQEGRLG